MRWKNPQGIEPYLRDLRVHLLYSVGHPGCAEDLSAPAATPAARKDRETAAIYIECLSYNLSKLSSPSVLR